jgi:hypothetical protein
VNTPADKEDILDAFATEPIHDKATLERYLTGYPEFAEEIIDLSTELRLSAASGASTTDPVPDPGLETAWDKLMACTPQCPQSSTADIFDRFQGIAFAALAKALNVPRTILAAIQEGLVVPESVPSGFLHRLSDAMSTPVSVLREHLARPHQPPVELAFKTDTKPSRQPQTTFRQLLLDTQMADEQRRILLHECDADELP